MSAPLPTAQCTRRPSRGYGVLPYQTSMAPAASVAGRSFCARPGEFCGKTFSNRWGHLERENYRTMTNGGRTSTSGTRTSTTGGPTMTAECSSYLPCPCRPPSSTRQPEVERRVTTQANSRIIFICCSSPSGGRCPMGQTSPWGITLRSHIRWAKAPGTGASDFMGEKILQPPVMDGETVLLPWGVHLMDTRRRLPEN